MKYRYQAVKMAVILICVLAAGVCYSCDGRQDGWESGELPVMNAPGDAGTSRAVDAPEGNGETGDSDPYGNAKESEETEIPVSVCYVHICGEVVLPGVYEMEEGSRIFQVVERAGGFTERAAAQYLNMAQVVCDGMKIVVPDGESLDGAERYGLDSEGGDHGAGSAGAGVIMPEGKTVGGSTAKEKVKVNLNTATREELMTLKGIGEARPTISSLTGRAMAGFRRLRISRRYPVSRMRHLKRSKMT